VFVRCEEAFEQNAYFASLHISRCVYVICHCGLKSQCALVATLALHSCHIAFKRSSRDAQQPSRPSA
jgi:hypothetical protein